MKDDDLEAGLPTVLCAARGELVSSGGSVALLFLQALITFCRLIASTEFFLRTRGLLSVEFLLFCEDLDPDFGDEGGVQLRHESDDLPEDTALSLSESSVLRTLTEPSSEFLFPIGGL